MNEYGREGTSVTLVKAMVELDRLGTPSSDTGRQAVEALLVHLVQMRDMDSETARAWVVDIFARLANHEVLTALTGSAEEWQEIPENQRGKWNYQNKRETSVMALASWVDDPPSENEQDLSGELGVRQKLYISEAVDVNALVIVREGEDNVDYHAYSTWMPVSFPYMPQRYHVRIEQGDQRTNEEIEEAARNSFQQVSVTGRRVS